MAASVTNAQARLALFRPATRCSNVSRRAAVRPTVARSGGGRGAGPGPNFRQPPPGGGRGTPYTPGGIIIPEGAGEGRQNFGAPGSAPQSWNRPSSDVEDNGPLPSVVVPREAPSRPEGGGEFYQPWRKTEVNLEVSDSVRQFANMDEASLLEFVQRRGGPWHEMGKAMQQLNAKGMTSELIFEITSISPREQNLMNVAANVLYTVINDVNQETAQYFNYTGQETLYEFRTLDVAERVKAAEFAAERQMGATEAYSFTKGIKEYMRRKSAALREGFTDSAGDMFALKYYRDAMEVRGEEKDILAKKGLEVAVSSSAKMSLERLLSMGDEPEYDPDQMAKNLSTVVLDEEEAAFWPLPVLGTLQTTTMSMFQNTPQMFTEGTFNLFKASSGIKYTAVPLFELVNRAEDPVGLLVPDTSTVTAIQNISSRKGEALLVVDREKRSPKPQNYYLVFQKSSLVIGRGDSNERASILAGRDIAGSTDMRIAGEVILAIRPRGMEGGDGTSYGSGDAVIQLDKNDI